VLFLVESALLLGVLAGSAHLAGAPAGAALLARALLATAVMQASAYYGEVHGPAVAHSRLQAFLRLCRAMFATTLVLSLLYYLLPNLRLPPAGLFVGLPLAAGVAFAWRRVHPWLLGQEGFLENVLVLGTGHTAELLVAEMLRRTSLGYRAIGYLAEKPADVGAPLTGPAVLGTVAEMEAIVQSRRVTLIVVALEDQRGRLPIEALLGCRLHGVQVEDAPSFFERLTGKILVSDLRPSWLVFSPGFRKPRFLRNAKRGIELVVAGGVLVLVAPLLVVLAVLIRLDSPGPAVYAQARVGLSGRVFDLYKLRTMRRDAEATTGPVWSLGARDERVTRVGRYLRKLRLDELPQLVNVLKGEMSLVGPRPERLHFVEQLRRVIPYYDERHSVRPGITGWAQVKFGYGSTIEDSERKLQFDLYYVKNMSLLLDLAIVLDTLKVMVAGREPRG
jgi:sugar transferase (PEP-CTERM system associated)